MDRPPIERGGVLLDGGTIRAVGGARELRRQCPYAEVVDLGEALVTPGLVNAHTHLELSDTPRPPPPKAPGGFVDWLTALIRGRIALGPAIHEASARAAARGAQESLAFGVTCAGDITRFARATRAALAQSPLRVVSFGEIQAMAGRRHLLEERFAEATDLSHDTWDPQAGGAQDAGEHAPSDSGAAHAAGAGGPRSCLMTAVSPHAPYSTEPQAFGACLEWSRANRRPLATHLAESPAESQFLAEHAGELRELWRRLGDWSDDVPRFTGGPIRLARELGLLEVPALLAHVNYVDDEELEILARGRASVVWCPRTHAYFGHPPHRFAEMMERGVRVCIATDSRASAPDLNLLEEARQVLKTHPHMSADVLWRMMTIDAAEALGVSAWVGSLTPGKWADLVVWGARAGGDASGALRLVLEEEALPREVWIGGERRC